VALLAAAAAVVVAVELAGVDQVGETSSSREVDAVTELAGGVSRAARCAVGGAGRSRPADLEMALAPGARSRLRAGLADAERE
jgi:hypothetical protein